MSDHPEMAGNLLAAETSPYLLQHKDNPVQWRPWGEAALAEAKRAGKPILLSIGYAACHWCHVMAHESFEDVGIAALMNRDFVPIKVDREERPDLDAIYQQALALLGQQGGWPLTMFLTPEGKPFWGGTYFPKEARWGRPGFADVLGFVARTYAETPDKVAHNVAALDEAMRKLAQPKGGGEIAEATMDAIAARLLEEIDLTQGGIAGAPKFPHFPLLRQFWHAYKRGGGQRYREAVLVSLRAMLQGGIYDHLGGGMARYAVDAAWLVPHFEKMLYDNAELLSLLALVWPETREPHLAARAAETADWLAREMRAAPDAAGNRAFAASLDADSEGEEGKFYVWSEAEIDAVLGPEAAFFKARYDVRPDGNWEGRTILNRSRRPDWLGERDEARLAAARAKLLARRGARQRPGWDDKVLADWNGMAVAALAEASLVFGHADWLALAESAFAFIAGAMWREGRPLHAWRAGRLAHPASIDDLAQTALAALKLHEATGKDSHLAAARALVALADRHHWDEAGGGYFFAADDTGDVIVRGKSAADQATPAGNGVMAEVLARLFHLTGEAAYEARAAALIAAFAGEVERNVFSLSTLLNANDLLRNAVAIVIVGERAGAETRALIAAAVDNALPWRILQVLPPGANLPSTHPAAGKGQVGGKATAYVCRGRSCGLPVADPAALRALLDFPPAPAHDPARSA